MLYLGLGLIALAIILFVISGVLANNNYYKDKKDAASCLMENVQLAQSGKCAIWDDSMCRKGTLSADKQECVSSGKTLPLILMVLSGLSLLAGIVVLFLHKKM